MRINNKKNEHAVEAKRARVRRFLDGIEYVQQEADALSQEELAARLEQLKQAAYEDYLAQTQGEKPHRAAQG